MRILQLSSASHFGGGERHFVDLTNGLIRKGHDVFIAIADQSPVLPALQNVPETRILRLSFRKPLDAASAWRLRRFARDHKIEILHAHMARDYPMAALAAGNAKYPRLILTRHVLFPMGRLHRVTRRRVARVIAVSEAVAESLRGQRIFDEDQIVVVRHGIDLGRLVRATRRTEGDVLRVGMLGELSPIKGQIDFVRAAAIIARDRAEVEFVIAGRDHSTDGSYGRELKQLVEANGLNARVRVVESEIDVPDFLGRLDVFVSASHSEAFGLAIVEAMAAGVPVVATATEGAYEIIADGVSGRLVPVGDVQQLATRISELLREGEQREKLTTAARQAAKDKFTMDRMIAETEEVYRAVLAK